MPPYQQPPSSPSPPPQSVLDAKPPRVLPSSTTQSSAAPSNSQSSSASAAQSALPPPPREVAAGLANLGNTCYINASMQALAHAPELCMALDTENHTKSCPIAKRNESRRRKRWNLRQSQLESTSDSSSTSSEEGKKSPSGKKKKKRREESILSFDPNLEGDEQDEFCTLCEVERLLGRVHSRPEEEEYMLPPLDQSGPVVPETFTAGFMGHVAPWFRRGVQEDSHEFLRLLIDAMQNSCKAARGESPRKAKEEKDDEYPFRLFRGTVESNVTCSSCRAVSCKIDPIEDIGLDILPVSTPPPSTSSRYRGSNSRSASPNNANTPLAAVQEALERFTSQESVAGYKCEKCRKGGKATKTSKLASIPPILTLHLKRFRYGSLSAEGNRRGAPRGNPLDGGPSGSAKIEGHVAFRTILDIKPYLTEELQETTFKKAFCRLFAVVVHNGKNSHSGHYVAYVQSLNNKEWWKMDDAKVSRVSSSEVLGCEAYMLFYRVVDHPVSKELAEVSGKKAAEEKRIRDEMERVVREAEERAKSEEERIKSIAALALAIETQIEPKLKEKASEDSSLGKRKRPELSSGEEWAKTLTSLPTSYYPLLQQIQDFISENVTFRPEFFTYITQEYNRMSSNHGGKKIKSLLGRGPSGVYPAEDVEDGARDIRDGVLDLFHTISLVYKQNDGKGKGLFLLPRPTEEAVEVPVVVEEPVVPPAVVDELIIPEPGDSFDGYDGAL